MKLKVSQGSWVVCRLAGIANHRRSYPTSSSKQFPLTCTDSAPPQPIGRIDSRGLRTPPYAYGWIVSYQQLLDGTEKVIGEYMDTLVGPVMKIWEVLGYAEKYGVAARPRLRALHEKRAEAVLVIIATNGSQQKIKSVISDDAIRTAARECFGNAKGVQQAPMWFRVDMENIPDGYEYEFEGIVGYAHYIGL
ncbi:hypothetical protein B0H17DRAFT_1131337 [Mycena rosella]|uniref:Uncharacterized protein n=1 Tax=Mycena rosella TaxID=1033263 RepID=A0AAD7DQC4_MYCRO|nr:hypothetical protein B0H17DRAFT_1131337 [Mycena rosella]